MAPAPLLITIPAALASGAHQAGEEGHLVIYLAARALDSVGSSRAPLAELERHCLELFSGKHYQRLLADERGRRYWTVEERALLLRGQAAVLRSHEAEREVIRSRAAITFPLSILTTRQRRGAALVAAILADRFARTDPASLAHVQRFAGVDRATLRAWRRDPVITEQILTAHAESVASEGRRIQQPNSWTTAGQPVRASFRLSKEVRSRPSDAGTVQLRRRYYRDEAELVEALRRVRKAGGDVTVAVARWGSVLVGDAGARRRVTPSDALELLGGPQHFSTPPGHFSPP